MNILIVNHNGGSIYHGPNLRTYYAAKSLLQYGHEVTIVSSGYSHKYITLPRIGGPVTSETIDGITYKWIKCIKYKGIVTRIYSHFEFGFKVLLHRKKISSSTDLVIFSGPPPELFLFVSKLARCFKVPVVSDVRDFWPLTQIQMNRFQLLNPYTYFLYFCQFVMFRRSSYIVSPLPGASEYVSKFVVGTSNVVVIENGFDTDIPRSRGDVSLEVLAAGNSLSLEKGSMLPVSTLRRSGRFVVGYAGAFDRDNDLDSLLRAAEHFNGRNDVVFLIVGAGVRSHEVEVAAKHVDNLLVCNRVESRFVPAILESMDVCFCGLRRKDIYKYGVSLAKSYEYMAAKRPIIWMIEACNNLVEDSGGGFVVAPENVSELITTVQYAMSLDEEELQVLGDKGYALLASEFSYNALGKKWNNLVSRVLL